MKYVGILKIHMGVEHMRCQRLKATYPVPIEYPLEQIKLVLNVREDVLENFKHEIMQTFPDVFDAYTGENTKISSKQAGMLAAYLQRMKRFHLKNTPESIEALTRYMEKIRATL